MAPSLHPLIDNGLPQASPNFSGGTLHCHCTATRVELTLTCNVQHNHACGCSKCWKPRGALFSIVGVVPTSNLSVTANEDKLHILDDTAVIQRHACKECGVHMFGRIVQDHAFKGLDFVHVELSDQSGWQEPQFAAFVSSVAENGSVSVEEMGKIRGKLREIGLESYDALSPELMGLLEEFAAKQKQQQEQAAGKAKL